MNNALDQQFELLKNSNDWQQAMIDKEAEAYRKFRPHAEKVKEIRKLMMQLCAFVEEQKVQLDEMGGVDFGALEKKIRNTSHECLGMLQEFYTYQPVREKLKAKMPAFSESKASFRHLTKEGKRASLNALKVKIVLSERKLIEFVEKKTGAMAMRDNNKFLPIVEAKSFHVKKGEFFEGKIRLLEYGGTSENMKIHVNGKEISHEDGLAKYQLPSDKKGKHSLTVSILVKNPVTNEAKSYKNIYEYEVI